MTTEATLRFVRTLARRLLSSAAATTLAAVATAAPPLPDAGERRADAAALCADVAGHYAYLAAKATDWDAACRDLAERAEGATTRDALVAALEHTLRELYDAHAHLGTHVPASPRLVPSQTDVLARFVESKPIVEAVRAGSAAQRAGMTPGQEIVAIKGVAVDDALRPYLPAHLARPDPAARDFALRVALAGRHDDPVQHLTVRADGGERTFTFAASPRARARTLSVRQDGGVAIVRINDALGEGSLVRDFDAAVAALPDARAMVLDLTDTPSGGNSTVARGILGRFVGRARPLPAARTRRRGEAYRRAPALGRTRRTATAAGCNTGRGAGRPVDGQHGRGAGNRLPRGGRFRGRRPADGEARRCAR